MKKLSWNDISRKFKGQWVALKSDEKTVVASGKNAEKVYSEAMKKGIEVPIMHKVPSKQGLYVGQAR